MKCLCGKVLERPRLFIELIGEGIQIPICGKCAKKMRKYSVMQSFRTDFREEKQEEGE